MENKFIFSLINGKNNPPQGSLIFDSNDHIRFQNGQNISGHNYNCHRRFVIEKNIEGKEGYTVTLYNLDWNHPIWQNNIQMAPKSMKIINVTNNLIELRGYGYDENAVAMGVPIDVASFANYGIILLVEDHIISRIQLNLFDRNVSIVYLS